MLTAEELHKRIACAALLPGPGPEALKEVCQSHLEALARLDEHAHRTVQSDLCTQPLVDSWKVAVDTVEERGEAHATLTLTSHPDLAVAHEYHRRKINAMLSDIYDSAFNVETHNIHVVDQRYAQDQMRYCLLLQVGVKNKDFETLATKSGLTIQELKGVCLGKTGLSYRDMARLSKAMFGDEMEMMVTMPWTQCGQVFSDDLLQAEHNGMTKELLDRECARLLQYAQEKGIVPNSTPTEQQGVHNV